MLTVVPKYYRNSERKEITMKNLERVKLLVESSMDTLGCQKGEQVGPRAN